MKPTPSTSIADAYANWLATGCSMLLGQFPSVQAMSLAPKIALRRKVSRAAPAKKRGNGRRPRAQSAAERKRMAR
jgi:hypothetical protein